MNLIEKEIGMTSLDVADLTGKLHKNVLQDIRNEVEILGEEIGRLIFQQSSYVNSQNKSQPMYKLTEEGVMQLALKYDAVSRYKCIKELKRLKELQIKAPPMTIEEIMLENVKSMIEVKNKISALEDKIDNKMGLTNSQAYQLQKKVNSKIINLFKTEFGKIAESEEEKVIYRKFFQEINKDLKSVYAVPSRNDIPQSKFEEAVEVVNSWYIPVKLKLEIKKFKEIKNV